MIKERGGINWLYIFAIVKHVNRSKAMRSI